MPGPSLLAFFAHPDDEAFSCGGTLAAAASRGIEVTVLSATRGERGVARDGTPRGELAARRTEELARSCRALGARPPRWLDLPDGELARHREELRRGLDRAIHDLRPDVVITMGPDGAYGHLDHVVCSEAMGEQAATASAPSTVLHTVFPPGLFRALREHLERAGIPLAPRGGPELPADYTVDVRRFEEQKLASIVAHRSQLRDGDPRSFLLSGIVDRLLAEERFRHGAGPKLSEPIANLFTGS